MKQIKIESMELPSKPKVGSYLFCMSSAGIANEDQALYSNPPHSTGFVPLRKIEDSNHQAFCKLGLSDTRHIR